MMPKSPVVVLLGGGVESTALVMQLLGAGRTVVPVHVHCGLVWDDCESEFVRRFCRANSSSLLHPLIEFRVPLADWLGDHWAITGRDIPRDGDDGGELEIPLRNLTLIGLTLPKVAHLQPRQFALGTTADNSFCDGTREYFDRAQELLSLEAGCPVEILTPYLGMTKEDVLLATDAEILALSFSCIDPRNGRHCGLCLKCGRRRRAFVAAGINDPTDYGMSRK